MFNLHPDNKINGITSNNQRFGSVFVAVTVIADFNLPSLAIINIFT